MTFRPPPCLALLLATILLACDPIEPPDISIINADPGIGATTNTPVIFSVSFSSFGDNGPYTYEWDFGDGKTSTSPKPGHKYESAGQYAVSVAVSNSAGSDTATTRVTISNPDSDLYFWTNTTGYGFISVTLNGMTRTITSAYMQFPGCAKNQGHADFIDLPYGTYTYTATSQAGKTWNGTITLNDNCSSVLLN